jgi:hypothetical protein
VVGSIRCQVIFSLSNLKYICLITFIYVEGIPEGAVETNETSPKQAANETITEDIASESPTKKDD